LSQWRSVLSFTMKILRFAEDNFCASWNICIKLWRTKMYCKWLMYTSGEGWWMCGSTGSGSKATWKTVWANKNLPHYVRKTAQNLISETEI
jgi:hypothetical protein